MDTLILLNEDIFLARGGCGALTLHLYHAGLTPHLLPISHKAYLLKAEASVGGENGAAFSFGLIQLLAPPWENIPPRVSNSAYVCMCIHVFVLQRLTMHQSWSACVSACMRVHLCVCVQWLATQGHWHVGWSLSDLLRSIKKNCGLPIISHLVISLLHFLSVLPVAHSALCYAFWQIRVGSSSELVEKISWFC